MDYKNLVAKHYILQIKRVNPFRAKKCFNPFEGFGIECAEGWYDLLDKLCTKIEKVLDIDPQAKKDFMIAQIKEKFGGLRFYVHGASEKIHKHIDWAEKESFKICEGCGKPGKHYSNYWYRTFCKVCEKKYQGRLK